MSMNSLYVSDNACCKWIRKRRLNVAMKLQGRSINTSQTV